MYITGLGMILGLAAAALATLGVIVGIAAAVVRYHGQKVAKKKEEQEQVILSSCKASHMPQKLSPIA